MLDSVSQSLDPNNEGYIFCGARSYQLISAPSFVTLVSGDTISVQSSSTSDKVSSPFTITLRSSLSSGKGTVAHIDETFTVTVNACPITSVTPSKTLGPYNYIYDDPQYSELLPTTWTIVPDCNWIPTYTVTANSPYSDIVDVSDNTNLKHSTQNMSLISQTFSVTVIATFPDPNAATYTFTI